MATHLLDDVQQVCDHVVMIDAGKLVVAGATNELLERTETVTVDVGHQAAELVAAASAAGLTARLEGERVDVTVRDGAELDALRDVIAAADLPLYGLTSRLTSLDDVFVRRSAGATEP